jgi:hypothetical protein
MGHLDDNATSGPKKYLLLTGMLGLGWDRHTPDIASYFDITSHHNTVPGAIGSE